MHTLTTSSAQETLPLRALLAYAARCARRVQSLYSLPADHPQAERSQTAVETAIGLAEEFAAGNSPDTETIATTSEQVIAALVLAGEVRTDDRRAAYAANAAYAVIDATADALESIHSSEAIERVVASVGIAYDSAVSADPRVQTEADRDRRRLSRLSLGAFPETGETVDPSVSGPLGPLFTEPPAPNALPATEGRAEDTVPANETEHTATDENDILSPPPLDASTKKFREWLRDFKRKHTQLARDREQLDNERLKLARQHKEIERDQAALDAERTRLSETQSSLDEGRAELRDRLQAEQDVLQAEQQEFARAQEAFEIERAAFQEQTDELNDRLAELEKTAAELDAQRTLMTEQQQQTEQQREQCRQRQEQLDQDEDRLGRDRQEHERKQAALDEERTSLRETRSALEKDRAELQEHLHSGQEAIEAERHELVHAQEAFEIERAAFREQTDSFHARLAELKKTAAELDAERTQIAHEREKLRADHADLETQQSELRAQFDSYQDQQSRLLEDKVECARKEAEIHKAIFRLRDECRQWQKETSTTVPRAEPAIAAVDPIAGLWELIGQLQQDRQEIQSLREQLVGERAQVRDGKSPETEPRSIPAGRQRPDGHSGTTMRPLRILLEPGLATEMQLAELFDDLSKLYRQLGGPGVRFTIAGCRMWTPPDMPDNGLSQVRRFADVRGVPWTSTGEQTEDVDPTLWNRFLSSLLIPLPLHGELARLYERGQPAGKNDDADRAVSAAAHRAAAAYAAHNRPTLSSPACKPGIDELTRQLRHLKTFLRRLADEQHLTAELAAPPATDNEPPCPAAVADPKRERRWWQSKPVWAVTAAVVFVSAAIWFCV